MANVEVRFSDNGDDRRISDVQLLGRGSVKRDVAAHPPKQHENKPQDVEMRYNPVTKRVESVEDDKAES